MPLIRRLIWLCIAAVAISSGSPGRAQEPENYLTRPALLERALNAVFEEIGSRPKVARIRIEAETITLRVQGTARPYDMDEWQARLLRRLFFDRDLVRGPTPVQDDGIVRNAETAFFDIGEVALSEIADLTRRAVEHAALDDPAAVSSVTIERRVSILPEPAYGEVRWTVPVASGRESAVVYANAAGEIVSADLSQTNRARRLDLIAQDDWPMAQAQNDLQAAIGTGESVHSVYVYNTYIFVEADHPNDPKLERDYSWDLSGVKRGLVDTPSLVDMGMGGRARFRLAELDLTMLPKVKQAARLALGMPSERIRVLSAEKSTRRAGLPSVLWTVEIEAGDSERGKALVNTQGEVVEATLPESRRPAEPWLAPATLVKTLARLEKTFGREARFVEISINDSKGSVKVEDPAKPGSLADFIVDAQTISRFGDPSLGPPNTALTDGAAFTLAELNGLTEARFADFAARTLARMKLDGAEVFRVTIWRRGVMVQSTQGKPIVEVRAGKDNGWISGWVVYELDGTEIDAVMP